MNFYQQQVLALREKLLFQDHLYRQVALAKQFIDRHYAENIGINDIANKAFLSKFHFIRLFKLIYGITPHQHLITVRMIQAKKLLLTGQTVSSVCFAVGFCSPSSFTGLFKRTTGCNPSVFPQTQQAQPGIPPVLLFYLRPAFEK